MLALSPVWHGRAVAVRRLANLVLQTLVIHPALLFFLLFLWISMNAGSGGQMLLNSAESLVRDAPASQVWGCQPSPEPTPPDVSGTAKTGTAEKFSELKPAPVTVLCKREPVSRDAWVEQTNNTLWMLYKSGVLLSLCLSICVWVYLGHAKGKKS
ncbi:hypothetical protein [Pantoea sp. OXWO6B1]|uniref:hypothetical protein n=1 Tax=Pantoea sp. OXWO6B1 TaxID=1835724 RepID=UPI0007C87684|nr:hypothetical protein [Pantoea sp. OXWO6B1]OAD97874.1 hypothetical protein A6A26_22050 [Pantoea sp. OXWO6B1]